MMLEKHLCHVNNSTNHKAIWTLLQKPFLAKIFFNSPDLGNVTDFSLIGRNICPISFLLSPLTVP